MALLTGIHDGGMQACSALPYKVGGRQVIEADPTLRPQPKRLPAGVGRGVVSSGL